MKKTAVFLSVTFCMVFLAACAKEKPQPIEIEESVIATVAAPREIVLDMAEPETLPTEPETEAPTEPETTEAPKKKETKATKAETKATKAETKAETIAAPVESGAAQPVEAPVPETAPGPVAEIDVPVTETSASSNTGGPSDNAYVVPEGPGIQ